MFIGSKKSRRVIFVRFEKHRAVPTEVIDEDDTAYTVTWTEEDSEFELPATHRTSRIEKDDERIVKTALAHA